MAVHTNRVVLNYNDDHKHNDDYPRPVLRPVLLDLFLIRAELVIAILKLPNDFQSWAASLLLLRSEFLPLIECLYVYQLRLYWIKSNASVLWHNHDALWRYHDNLTTVHHDHSIGGVYWVYVVQP